MEYIKRGRWRYLAFVCQSCDKQFERRIDRVNATGAKAICSSCVLSEKAKQNKKHGFYGTPTYVSWVKMKDRCLNPRHKYFYLYGGRGITIDPKWMDFIGFLEDMGPMPVAGYSIDRIDNDLGYSKSNCRWIPRNEQQKNRRVCKAKPGRIAPPKGVTMSAKGEKYKSKKSKMRHEKMEGAKERMMEYGSKKGGMKKAKKKK